jgi:hypothetical protein
VGAARAAAPTNALVEQSCPLVEPGDEFTATFSLRFDRDG